MTYSEFILFIIGFTLFIWACFTSMFIARVILATLGSLFALTSVYIKTKRKNKGSEITVVTTMMISVIFFIFIGIIALYIGEFGQMQSFSPEGFGQFGDLVGGILNPVVAICALVALMKGTKMQHDELNDARKETKDARDSEKKAQDQQQEQYFQQRFFDWMNLYRDSVNQIELIVSPGISIFSDAPPPASTYKVTGKKALENILNKFEITPHNEERIIAQYLSFIDFSKCQKHKKTKINEYIIYLNNQDSVDLEVLQINWGELFYRHNELSPYFRIIFNFLDFAQNHFGHKAEEFVKIFRAQLTEAELLLLASNMLFNKYGKKMIPWANEFSLLKHIPEHYYILRELVICHIGQKALESKQTQENDKN